MSDQVQWKSEYERRRKLARPLIDELKKMKRVSPAGGFENANWFSGNFARRFESGTKKILKGLAKTEKFQSDLREILAEPLLEERTRRKCYLAKKYFVKKKVSFSRQSQNREKTEQADLLELSMLKIIDMALKELLFLDRPEDRRFENFDPPMDKYTIAPIWKCLKEKDTDQKLIGNNPTAGSLLNKNYYNAAQELVRQGDIDPFTYEFVFWHFGTDPLLSRV